MIAELVLAGVEGGSWDNVAEAMTLPRYGAIRRVWAAQPPTHLMVAAYLGIGKDRKKPAERVGDMGDLIAYLGADAGNGRGAVLK
jgi:hypothetical protein